MTNPITPETPDVRYTRVCYIAGCQATFDSREAFNPVYCDKHVARAKADDSQDELERILAEYSYAVQDLIADHKPFDDGKEASRWRHNAKSAILAAYLPKSQALLRKDVEAAIKNAYEYSICDMKRDERQNGKEPAVIKVDDLLKNLGLATPEKEEKQHE